MKVIEAEEAEVVDNLPKRKTTIIKTKVRGQTAKQKAAWIHCQISKLEQGIESRRMKIKNLKEQKKLYEKIAHLEEEK